MLSEDIRTVRAVLDPDHPSQFAAGMKPARLNSLREVMRDWAERVKILETEGIPRDQIVPPVEAPRNGRGFDHQDYTGRSSMIEVTPAGRLEMTFRAYRLDGPACMCRCCGERQAVGECRQAFPHRPGCGHENAETHPWIIVMTAIDWAMRRADPVAGVQVGRDAGMPA